MDINLVLSTLQTVASVALIVAIGFAGVKAKVLGEHTLKELSAYLIYVAVPCTIISHLYGSGTIKESVAGVGITALSQIIAVIIGFGLTYLFGVNKEQRGVNAVSFGICNSGFIGLPIVTMLFGDAAKSVAIYFIISNNIVFWTLGAFLIKGDAKRKGTLAQSKGFGGVSSINPPIAVFVIMLLIKAISLPLPRFFMSAVEIVDATTAPAALFFCGTVLGGIGFKNIKWQKGFSLIMLGRYLISPLVMAGLFIAFPMGDLTQKVMIIQAAMPVVTLVEVGAKKYGGDVEYASLGFIFSLLLLAITLPITYYLLMTLWR